MNLLNGTVGNAGSDMYTPSAGRPAAANYPGATPACRAPARQAPRTLGRRRAVTPDSYFEAIDDRRYKPTPHVGGAWRRDEVGG